MKIQIIGYSGSGKSTMAARLGELLEIPVLHLDNLHWYGNWQEQSDAEMSALTEAFLNGNDDWVIDGNYSCIAPDRFRQSDITLFFDFGRIPCFLAALGRYRRYRGKARESCPCPEKFDRTFRHWLLVAGRTGARRSQHQKNLALTAGKQIVLKNRRQAERFFAAFAAHYQDKECN